MCDDDWWYVFLPHVCCWKKSVLIPARWACLYSIGNHVPVCVPVSIVYCLTWLPTCVMTLFILILHWKWRYCALCVGDFCMGWLIYCLSALCVPVPVWRQPRLSQPVWALWWEGVTIVCLPPTYSLFRHRGEEESLEGAHVPILPFYLWFDLFVFPGCVCWWQCDPIVCVCIIPFCETWEGEKQPLCLLETCSPVGESSGGRHVLCLCPMSLAVGAPPSPASLVDGVGHVCRVIIIHFFCYIILIGIAFCFIHCYCV